jgi:hypothetical protein
MSHQAEVTCPPEDEEVEDDDLLDLDYDWDPCHLLLDGDYKTITEVMK